MFGSQLASSLKSQYFRTFWKGCFVLSLNLVVFNVKASEVSVTSRGEVIHLKRENQNLGKS